MAILALTKDAASSLLSEYGVKIENYYEQYNISKIKDSLRNQLNILCDNASSVYQILGYSGSNNLDEIKTFENQLFKKIEEAKKTSDQIKGIGALTGKELEKTFIYPLINNDKYVRDLQEKWEIFLNSQGINIINSELQGNLHQLATNIASDLFEKSFQKASLGSTSMIHIKTSGSRGVNLGRINATFNKCGQKVQEAFRKFLSSSKWQQIYNKYNKTNNITNITYQFVDVGNNNWRWIFSINGQGIEVNPESFLQMNDKEREDFFAGLTPQQKLNLNIAINEAYKQEILNRCKGANQTYLSEAIDKVINSVNPSKSNLNAFFGATGANLTGRLGEIAAIYYLLYISDGQLLNNIDWIGGINNPHADLLITQGLRNYGIQVKNTTKDIFNVDNYTVDFKNFKYSKNNKFFDIDNRFYSLQHTDEAIEELSTMGMPHDMYESIENILSMKSFNIEYQRYFALHPKSSSSEVSNEVKQQWWKAVQAPNEEFHPIREKIEKCSNICQALISLFVVNLMYMQLTENTMGEANTVYIVGGSIIISAATIIGRILNSLDEELNNFSKSSGFEMSFGMEKEGDSFTIVDLINSKGFSNNNLNTQNILNSKKFAFKSSFTFISK